MTGIPDELTDQEWRAFQAIPDQGYSHRGWVNDRIRERLEAIGLPVLIERMKAAEREIERLRNWKAEAMQVMSGLQDVGNALGIPLGQQITARATVDAAIDLRNQRDALAAKVADAGERIALAIEKANRKVIDARVADDYTRPQIVDRVLTYAAQVARTALTEGCPTPGCDGDSRYAAPGRGHSETCHFPLAERPEGA